MEAEVIGTIDLTPTDEGFANIARTFAASLRSDVRKERREDATAQVYALCDIVRYLAAKSAANPASGDLRVLVATLMADLKTGVR
jgi:hypothetical protein